ncbi:FAD-binding oxidoreductase [Saccharomonospora xinjiangensis]|uniref:FAD/FMN-dependent dehydrogenase n=1 Tax=Saccharomonospora xinjiangensis XJ-54 TaxID=882086 RepID=I0V8R5_9PSEU|nr:FAD-binding oxidoreductase [Saccharomonospora xinjiangensis]EID56518.1 FAD/FMN-dependent dehydrogenase [Saccharomonospora xinjiangensis XJ-54]
MTDRTPLRADLSAHTRAPVLTPGTGGYDAECGGYQLLDPHTPITVLAATRAEDVRAAVSLAATRGVPFAVQATGHGRVTPTTGLLISTRRMTGVRVDPAARTAWVEAGATWRHVVEAAAPHGLAPLSGSFPGVGAVSYTLGGGLGLLARRYGLACDHVRRFDVVTPDGRARQVTEHREPELFWALRGGGGHVGVVTGMEIGLVPVAHVYGGSLLFDVEQAPDVLDAWRRWTSDLPGELTSAVTVLTYPDLPGLPDPLRGRPVAHMRVVHCGKADEGRELVEPLRAIGPVIGDTLAERSYLDTGAVFDEPEQPHPYLGDNVVVRDLDPQALAGLTKAAGPSAPVLTVVGLRHLGGAIAEAPRGASAVGHRDGAYLVSVLSPVEGAERERVRGLHDAALGLFTDAALGRWLNFTFRALNPAEMRSAFAPGDYERLRRITDEIDPGGLLHTGHGGVSGE